MEDWRSWARVSLSRAASAVLVTVAVGATAFACTTTPPPAAKAAPDRCKFQVVDMTILGSRRLNPTETGEARPVQLRIYQSKSDARFNFAEFEDIWKKDQKTLGDDYVSMQEITVYPESRADVRFERDEAALNIVAMGLFRNPSGRTWWTSFDLPPPPGKGECGADCPDGQCDGGSNLNPHYVVWLDGTRVDDGADHLDDYPEGRWPRQSSAKLSPAKAAEKAEK